MSEPPDRYHPRHPRLAAVVLLAAGAAALAACAWGPTDTHPPAEVLPPLVWPEPPDPARIALRSIFSGPADLGIKRSIWARMANLISGRGELRMLRPTGVAASGTLLAVADPGAGLVHLYDLAARRALTLTACGDTALRKPVAVALLGDRLYAADAAGARIAVFTVAGACERTWALDPGSRPAGLAVDPQRMRLYVADVAAHRVLAFDAQGRAVLRFGRRGSGSGELNYPTWLAVDGAGNVYVTDALNFRVQIFAPDGTPIGAFGSQGDGSGDLARPNGIAVDRDGHVYLVDALFGVVQIFDRDGRYLMAFGAQGRGPGQFWLPTGLAIDADRIYVADSYNRRVQVFRYLGGEP